VVTGGVARPQSYELIGPLATRLLAELTLDQVCLGVDAISLAHGATAYHEGEASINQLMVSRAREVIVVADSSKLGRHAFARICPITDVTVLVTDSTADEPSTTPFTDAGVRVIRA
jgi:DeoR/GlpR family transcriptional regulator of sugar metabolism